MRKFAHPIGKFCFLLLVLTVFWAIPAFSQDSTEAPKTAGEVYKNIQVLKDMPAPHLMEVMHAFKDALGVKCSFCHVEGAFDRDDKPEKQTARKMFKMVEDINSNYISKIDSSGAPVTCGTCHRGHLGPEPFVPAPEKEHAH